MARSKRPSVGLLAASAGFLGLFGFLASGSFFGPDTSAFHPDHQGEGIGRALLYFAEQEADDNCLARLFLYTNVNMTKNLNFYPQLGYVEKSRVSEDGFDIIYFEKRITHES